MIQIHIARQQGITPTAAADAINAYLVDWQEQHPKRRVISIVSAETHPVLMTGGTETIAYNISGTEITVIFSSEDVA